jgi:hypothetical protein
VQLVSGDNLSSDHLLGNLFGTRDAGQQIKTKETEEIIAGTGERMYKWLHQLAGVK